MSIHKDKRTGKWYAHVRYEDWQGQRQRKIKRGFVTKREALDWERGFIMQRSDDLNMTFAQFFAVYEEDRRPRLRLSTWINKECIVNDKIMPFFGKRVMSEITSKDIIRWQNTLLQKCDKYGKPYTQTYIKTVYNQLTAIFSHATRFYGLKTNPSSKAGSIGKKHADEMKFWTREEYRRFANVCIRDSRFYYPFEVLYWCGLRLGELLALTYEDINFEKKTIRINKSLQRISCQDVVTDPKTPKSKRTTTMPDFLCNELKEYMALQYSFKPTDRVFNISKSNLGKYLKLYGAAAGLNQIRVHDLRHSHVSLLIELGFSALAIADRVGHESVEITYRYAHLFPTKQAQMAERLNLEGAELEAVV
jgi:integrase